MTENPLNVVCKLCNGISGVYAIFFDDYNYVNICTDPQMSDVHICLKCIKSLQCCRELRDELHVEPTVSFVTWIPVGERLPDRDRVVTIAAPMPYGSLPGYYDGAVWRLISGHQLTSPVTHWAELPTPPAPEDDL